MPYAIVQDVPASWEQYEPLAAEIREGVPDGLILHLAGPTDEGFRTIEVWETREAWQRFRERASRWTRASIRELRAVSTVEGASR